MTETESAVRAYVAADNEAKAARALTTARAAECAASNPLHVTRSRVVEMPSGQYSRSEGPYVIETYLDCPRCAADPLPLLPQDHDFGIDLEDAAYELGDDRLTQLLKGV